MAAPSPITRTVAPAIASASAGAVRSGTASESDGAIAQTNAEIADVDAPLLFMRNLSQQTAVTVSALTPVSFSAHDRVGITPAAQPVIDPEFVQFNLLSGIAQVSPQEVERTLRSPAMLEQLDKMREAIRKDLNLEKTVAITAAGATFGVSVVYVLWLIRGGVLMGSYLSALPAWQVLDPLPVLERLQNPEDEEDDSFEEFESLRVDPLQSLRGY